jgi:drug/metabolite transporter (DMT)-like permease
MRGALLCLLSAAAFATLGIFGRLAAEDGATAQTTLLARFGLAALVFAAGLTLTGRWRRPPRRVVLTGLGLGAFGYSLQSGLFFAAIGRLDVSLVALVLYTYPAFVTLAALALGRAQPSLRVGAALAVALAGVALVLLATGAGTFDLAGALMALGAALTYTTYILVADRVIGETDPFALALLVFTGATGTYAVFGTATGSLELALPAQAWLWLVLIALVSTVVAVSMFFAGLRRVGASEAAILSTFEPPVTVALAFVALGERLTVLQLAGGALVLTAVILLQLPARSCDTGTHEPHPRTREPRRRGRARRGPREAFDQDVRQAPGHPPRHVDDRPHDARGLGHAGQGPAPVREGGGA